MPKNTNILMIRHSEKPDSGTGLDVAGQERAQAYVIYFQNYSLNSNLVKLEYLIAAADSSESHRPRLTIQPLATAIGLDIDAKHKDKHYQKVADDILQNSKYDGSNILICWHHGEILDLAAALGAKRCRRHPIGRPRPGRNRCMAGCCSYATTPMGISIRRKRSALISS